MFVLDHSPEARNLNVRPAAGMLLDGRDVKCI